MILVFGEVTTRVVGRVEKGHKNQCHRQHHGVMAALGSVDGFQSVMR